MTMEENKAKASTRRRRGLRGVLIGAGVIVVVAAAWETGWTPVPSPERTLATGTIDSEHWKLTAHREHGSLCMSVDIASVRNGDNVACGFDGKGGTGYWWEVPTDSYPAVYFGPLPSNAQRVDVGPDLHATVDSFPLTFGQGTSKYWVYAATAESSKRMFDSPHLYDAHGQKVKIAAVH